jgi:8-oxo-dGTP diphosphatase
MRPDNRKRSMLFVVASALVAENGEVLLQRRPPKTAMADLWEFPGGKVEADETPEAALVRELREELGVEVDPGQLTPVGFASEALDGKHLVLLLYLVTNWVGVPEPLHASELCWVLPSSMRDLPMPPADMPLIAQLERALSERLKAQRP